MSRAAASVLILAALSWILIAGCDLPAEEACAEQSKVKGAMREVIDDSLKYLSRSDLEAIADYLFAQPPIVHNVTRKR